MVQKVLPFYLKNVQKLQNSMLLYLNYTSFEIRDILKFAMALCDELIANFEGYLYRQLHLLLKASDCKLTSLDKNATEKLGRKIHQMNIVQ